MARRYCTIPKILGLRKWYVKHFNEPCRRHDYYYETMKTSRLVADYKLALYMVREVKNKSLISKLFVFWPVVVLTYIGVSFLGWIRWGKE